MSDNEEGLYKEDSRSPRSNGELTPTSRKSDSPASEKFKSDESVRRSLSRSRSRSPSGSESDRRRSYSRSRSRSPPPRYSRSRSGSFKRNVRSDRRRDYYPRSRSRSPSPPYRSRGRGQGGPPRRRHVGDRDAPEPSRCLGVFGLGMYTQERDLRDVFNRYGPIEDIQIVYDRQTSRSRGFGFIYFKNVDDAVEAKDRCNGLEVDGRRIRVDYSITERAHTPTPGVYLGKPSSERYRGYRNNYHGRRRSPSPYYRRRTRSRSRSRSWSPPRRY